MLQGISDLADWYKIHRKHNSNVSYTSQNRAIAIHSSITIPPRFPLLMSKLCSPTGRWASPVIGKEYAGRSQLRPIAAFKTLSFDVEFSNSMLGWGTYSLPPTLVWLLWETFTLFQWTQGETFTPAADPLGFCHLFIETKGHPPVVPFVLRVNTSQLSLQQSHAAPSPKLHGHITLAHPHWAFFWVRGLLVSHSKPSPVSDRALGGQSPVTQFSAELDGDIAEILKPEGWREKTEVEIAVVTQKQRLLQNLKEKAIAKSVLWMLAASLRNSQWNLSQNPRGMGQNGHRIISRMAGKEGCRFALGAVGPGVSGKHWLWKYSQRDKEHRLKLEGALLVTCFDSSHEIWNWASPAYCSAALCLKNHHHKGACIAVSHFCQPSLNLASHAQVICACLKARVHRSTLEGLLHKAQNSWINYFC